MGYIRSNEDYYESLGFSHKEARVRVALDKANIDYGYCNPLKAKFAHEEEQEIRKRIENENS